MAESSKYRLDAPALHGAVLAVARHRQMHMKQVAAETGLAQSTFTRLGQGKTVDADGLLTLLAWLRAPAREFTRLRETGDADG